MKKILATAAAFGLIGGFAVTAHATNGMNIEGYGPISLGMGGAAYAYDVGTAAMMSNPATIGLSEGHRFDLALGFLGPVSPSILTPPSTSVPLWIVFLTFSHSPELDFRTNDAVHACSVHPCGGRARSLL